jgi:hypothetical protein
MVVNFRARGISRGTRKLAWTLTLIKKTCSNTNLEECNSTDQVLVLFPKRHQLESHKHQGQ